MQPIPDGELLGQFARTGAEEAFGELVRRHIGLVHSVALRHTDNPHHAEEITQAVFIILARKAGSLGRRTVLSGWLYHTARLTAANFRRSEFRRLHREQEAFMQSTPQETTQDSAWPELAPLLEEAMARLGEADRAAVVLRYFENRTLSEVGAALGVADRAAQKRVSRALERLRTFFTKRGVTSTTAIIADAISAHSVQAAPVALAKSVTAAALAKGAAASGSTLTLIKGALKIMAWTKAKTVIVASAAVRFVTGTTVVVVERVVSPAVDESFWDYKNFRKAPSALIIRPTRYSDSGMIAEYEGSGAGKAIMHNTGFASLLMHAYSSRRFWMVMPTNVPQGRFDLMLTLPDHPKEALQKAIQRKFGFTARRETREADVLVLKVKDPRLLALHASKPGSKVDFKHDYKQSKSVEGLCQLPHRHGSANTGESFLQTSDCATRIVRELRPHLPME